MQTGIISNIARDAFTVHGIGYTISTVQLPTFYGVPQFETVIFESNGDIVVTDYTELATNCYSTREDALAGHTLLMERYIDFLNGGDPDAQWPCPFGGGPPGPGDCHSGRGLTSGAGAAIFQPHPTTPHYRESHNERVQGL